MRIGFSLMFMFCAATALADNADNDVLQKKVENLVRERLKDPDAATFKNVYANKLENGGIVICGEVNSKNIYGGYVGFQKFYSPGTRVLFREDSPSTFDRVYKIICPK